MSLIDQTTLSVIRAFTPGIVDFAVTKSNILRELKNRGCIKYKQPILDTKDMKWFPSNGYLAQVTSPGDYTPLQATQQDNAVTVTAPISTVFVGIAFSEMIKRRLSNFETSRKYYDWIASQMAAAKFALGQTLVQDLFWDGGQTRTGPSPVTTRVMKGLQNIISATSTLYTIDRSQTANAYARSQTGSVTAFATADANGQPEGIRKMEILSRNINNLGKKATGPVIADEPAAFGEEWSCIFASPTAEQLYLDSQASRARGVLGENTDMGAAGATAFKKKPLYQEPACTVRGSAHEVMYFVNLDHLRLDVIDSQLFDVYAEDDTNLTQSTFIGGQHCLTSDKPSVHGVLDITA